MLNCKQNPPETKEQEVLSWFMQCSKVEVWQGATALVAKQFCWEGVN